MDNLPNPPPQCLQSISSFSKSPEMPEMTEALPEKSVKRIEKPAISSKKIAQLEADLEEMNKDKDVEMCRLAAKMAQIQANLKIAKLEVDLVDGRERNRELERKIAEMKSKKDHPEANSDQNTEVRDRKAKIGKLDGKITALQRQISGFETQIKSGVKFFEEIQKSNDEFLGTGNWMGVFGKNRFLVQGLADVVNQDYLHLKAFDEEMTFDEAEAYCASQKSHLVSIHSQKENDLVQKVAKTVGSNAAFWIGLKRNPDKGNAFEWMDGSSVDFTNWMVREPDSNTHAALGNDKGDWVAYRPADNLYFICKRSSQF